MSERGFTRKVGGWAWRKVQPAYQTERASKHVRTVIEEARNSARPARLDRTDFLKGLNGRHHDGGKAKFAEAVKQNDFPADKLDHFAAHNRKIAAIYLAVGLIAPFIGYLISGGDQAINFGPLFRIAVIFVMALAFVVSVKHDFSSWQISNRRFGSFREYVKDRLS